MRKNLLIAAAAVLMPFTLVPTAGATGVDRHMESAQHEVQSQHDFNICGNLATFTFDVTWHAIGVDTGKVFAYDYTETAKYTLVFDDPALGTWNGHGAESFHFVATPGGTVQHEIYNGAEGPVQIIEHQQIHTDADGNVTIDRYFELHVGC